MGCAAGGVLPAAGPFSVTEQARGIVPAFVYSPLYLRRVASPPRICRSALFRSSSCRTCRYRPGFSRGRRSVKSLCTVLLLTPNLAAAARTVALFSRIYTARSQALSSILVRTHTTPRTRPQPRVLWDMYMKGRLGLSPGGLRQRCRFWARSSARHFLLPPGRRRKTLLFAWRKSDRRFRTLAEQAAFVLLFLRCLL